MNDILRYGIQFLPDLLSGLKLTIIVSFFALVLASLLGFMIEALRWPDIAALDRLNSAIVIVLRGIPILVYIYFAYFALPEIGINFPAIVAGVVALGVGHAVYMAENLRLSIQAIDSGQREAAISMGMSTTLVMRRVLLPQAIRPLLPAYGNSIVMMIKDSSLCALITVGELTRQAYVISAETFKTMLVFTQLAIFYMLICVPMLLLIRMLETRIKKAARND